ncbi:MAG TPA: hypothetical protein HA366_00885 [Candidatus Methanomethylophilaceae archaeon]|nr:hypothetical protein [Candidatus Methanomethylophilaceae archaeon]
MEFADIDDLGFMENKQFISNCRGFICKEDNAERLCAHYIPNGSRLFAVISAYDYVQSYLLNRENYKTGDSLRLILPFLKAAGATDSDLLQVSRKNINLVPGAAKTMRYLNDLMPAYVVSASYDHHIMALCEVIDFPYSNVYCTNMQLDMVEIDDSEAQEIMELAEEIAAMPVPQIPRGAMDLSDLCTRDRETVQRLDEIFWDYMLTMEAYSLISSTNPLGGNEKVYSILDIRRKTMVDLDETMYIGGGITDIQAMELIRDSGGLTVSFNGNRYAVREADIAVMSPNTVIISLLATTFYGGGVEAVCDLADDWSKEGLQKSPNADPYLVREVLRIFPNDLPKVIPVNRWNVDEVIRISESYRIEMYGEYGWLS